MDTRQIMSQALQALLDKGADKVALWLTEKTKEEFNIVYKELNLLRSVESQNFNLIVIKDQKQATTTLNQFDPESVAKAVEEVMANVLSSNADPAFDISPYQEPQTFTDGPMEMDADLIVKRLEEFNQAMRKDYPSVYYDAILSHTRARYQFLNSNGVDFCQNWGYYGFTTMFTAKEDKRMSSFNGTSFNTSNLDKPLLDYNFTGELMRQITQQTLTQPIPQNFTGEVLLCPFVTGELLDSLISQQFGSSGLLTNSSRFPDHVGQKVLDARLSVYNKPSDPRLAIKDMVTSDGYVAQEGAIIENGVLKHYPIGLFTANKVGKARTFGTADSIVVEAGPTPLAEMIKSIREGVLCMRASFGNPNPNGDLSAVLKNSYYIKDGAIQFPISESMMSINLIDIFNNIVDISRETFNTGSSIYPYIQVKGAAISRK